MENKLLFILILIGVILVFLGIIVTIIFLLMNKKEDWRDYDCYILSIFWSPSICYNLNEKSTECFDTLDKLDINKSLIINGLWVAYSSEQDLEKCNKDEDINVVFNDDTKKTFSKIWPGLNQSDNDKWNYEYNQYGYCYIQRIRKNVDKNYTMYFDQAKKLFDDSHYSELIEHILPDTPQGLHTISKKKFQTFINESLIPLDPSTYSLRCEKYKEDKYILKELQLKYDIDFNLTSNFQLNDNCPDRFDIYFRDKKKKPVWEKITHYEMTLFWPATFCLTQGKECYKKIKERELNMTIIHGLLPSYDHGAVPQWCNLDVDIEIDQHTPDMDFYWVNMDSKDNKEFWNQEYNRHGFCYNKKAGNSTKDYLIYFNKTLELYKNFPTLKNGTINLKDLMHKYIYPGMFAGMNELDRDDLIKRLSIFFGNYTFGMTCLIIQGEYYLHQIIINLNLDLKSFYEEPGELVICPRKFYAEFLEVEGKQPSAPADFYKEYDMYFFTILWLGTTCHKKGEQCYIRIPEVAKNKFTMHGLWPNFSNGTLVDFCNAPNDIEIDINNESLLNFMNEHYVSGYHTNKYFWGHEYNKHGYCYNQRLNHDVKDYEFYFQKIKDMFIENDFENLFIDYFAKEGKKIEGGDLEINRTKFEALLNDKGFANDEYLIVCTNVTIGDTNYSHISEMRIRYHLNFTLMKNETDKSEFDCPEIFYAQFFNITNNTYNTY